MQARFLLPVVPLAALSLLLSATPACAQTSQAEALRGRATEVLRAYRARDVDALVALVPPAHRDRARDSLAPGSSRRESIFGERSWRWRAVEGWDGALREVRVRGPEARVRFGALEGGEVAVVTLRKVDGQWYFEDVHSPTARSFATWGERLE